jgi:hypothetical protein
MDCFEMYVISLLGHKQRLLLSETYINQITKCSSSSWILWNFDSIKNNPIQKFTSVSEANKEIQLILKDEPELDEFFIIVDYEECLKQCM